MAAILLAIARERSLRRQRVFRDRSNPLDCCSDLELIRRYRFPRQTISEFAQMVEIRLERPTQRSHPLPVISMVCLVFFLINLRNTHWRIQRGAEGMFAPPPPP